MITTRLRKALSTGAEGHMPQRRLVTIQTPRQRTNLPAPRHWTRLHRQPAPPHPPRHTGADHRNHQLLAVRPCQGPRRMLRRRNTSNTPGIHITWRPHNARMSARRGRSAAACVRHRGRENSCPPACRGRPAAASRHSTIAPLAGLARPVVREIPVPQCPGFPSHPSTTYVELAL
jgi:hypothetical protein